MKNNWKNLVVVAFVAVFVAAMALTPNEGHAKKWRLSIATGGTGGSYYPMGGGVGELLRQKVDMIDSATAEVTAGSVENVQLVNRGKADLGLVCWIGPRGAGLTEKIPNVRTLFFIHGSTGHWAVGKKSGIKTFEDMKGKVVALDAPGSAGLVACELVFKLFGIDTNKDIKAQRITQGKGVDGFKDGRIDVVYGDVGYPNSSFMDLCTVRDVTILSFPPEVLKKISDAYPSLPEEVIPGGTYNGNPDDVHTFTEAGPMVCRADLPEDLVYEIVKTIAENQAWLAKNVHAGIARWKFDPSVAKLAPLHPGAEKYYKEKGLL